MVEIRINGRVEPWELDDFFEGWLVPPTLATREGLFRGSGITAVARDGGRLVGFLTAITDGCMHAMITLVEVRTGYRRQGVGSDLVRATLHQLGRIMDVVVTADEETSPFYAALGFEGAFALRLRDRDYRDGD